MVIALASALVAAVLVLAACGGDDEGPPTSPAPSEAPSGQLPPGFAECLADQGVEIEPDADINEIFHGGAAPPQVVEACFESLHGRGGGP